MRPQPSVAKNQQQKAEDVQRYIAWRESRSFEASEEGGEKNVRASTKEYSSPVSADVAVVEGVTGPYRADNPR